MIHCYKQGGIPIVLDVNSGAVHVMDELGFELAGLLEPPLQDVCPEAVRERLQKKYAPAQIDETYAELLALYREGQLYSSDDYLQLENITALSPVKAMCLHVAHDCNMRCAYCFASSGDYHGQRALMDEETACRAIDYLIERSGPRKNLEVDFFGGEPLMAMQTVMKTIGYAREREKETKKHFRFTITTNGLWLDDENTRFINLEMDNVVLSLDGRREVHDRVRRRADSMKCYDEIVPKFQALVAARGDRSYYVRGTFTKYNMDFSEDVLALNNLGFEHLSVEPVVAEAAKPYALTPNELARVFAEYERLADIIVAHEKSGERLNFFHFLIDLEQGPCAIKRLRGCGCGNEYVAVAPNGDVYPCHQFVGHEDWRMGNVFDATLDEDLKKKFAHSTVYGKESCRGCWAKFYCSGGCNANAMLYNGDILKPYEMSCEMEKKRIECALYIKAATAEES